MSQDKSSFWQKISGFAKDREDSKFAGGQGASQFANSRLAGNSANPLEIQRKKDYFIRCQELRALRRMMQQKSWAESDEAYSRHTAPASALSREETLKRITEIEATFNGNAVKRPKLVSLSRPMLEINEPPAKSQSSVLASKTMPASALDASIAASQIAQNTVQATQTAAPKVAKAPTASSVATPSSKVAKPAAPTTGSSEGVYVNRPGQQVPAKPQMFAATQVISMGSDISRIRNKAVDEAAAAFSKGEPERSKQRLEQALAAGQELEKDVETWKAFFDLLRTTNDAASFSKAAKRYVELTGNSFPRWSSKPKPTQATGPANGFVCGKRMGSSQANLLVNTLSLASESKGVDLNFDGLRLISDMAYPILHKALVSFANFAGEARISGVEYLLDTLTDATPPGDKEVDTLRWETKLLVLRMLGRESEYEFVGLDFAATFRISPPAYKPFRLKLTLKSAHGVQSSDSNYFGYRLSGVITGSRRDFLTPLAGVENNHGKVEVSLHELERMDYPSATALRDWARNLSSQGKEVHFSDVNRMIAVLLAVAGVSSYAQIHLSEP